MFSKYKKSMLNLLENLNYFLEGKSLSSVFIDKSFKISIRAVVNNTVEVV